MSTLKEIRRCIEGCLDKGCRNFIIYPYGQIGMEVKRILNDCYGITEFLIVDENLCAYNAKIHSPSIFREIDCSKYIVLLSTSNEALYTALRENLAGFFAPEQIAGGFVRERLYVPDGKTKVGKYSYGPLCDNELVESVGAFCSFAIGSNAVGNHCIDCISTHPFVYIDKGTNPLFKDYEEYSRFPWYVDLGGKVKPKGKAHRFTRSKIGNDVWIGRNALLTNGADIGNGAIVGAGSVVTKDVPDYAVVAGTPARILRYRYLPEQIEKLNKICWWDWDDEEIRSRYSDFFLPVEEFIEKYDCKEKA